MSFVTTEQIRAAKQMDLLTYLQHYEPDELVRVSAGNYCTRSHDSLKISNGKWHWFSRGIGGRSALDYLVQVKEMPFTEAVELLAGKPIDLPPFPFAQKQKERHLELPALSDNSAEAAQYLIRRGIDWEVISLCQEHGLLFETKDHRAAVFAGYDESGAIRYAALRGIHDSFKGEAPGSDKRYAFCIPGDASAGTVHLFECAIDAMSYATLLKLCGRDWTQVPLLSLGGVYNSRGAKSVPAALQQYLSAHPNTRGVFLHFDNDEVGRGAAEGIVQGLTEQYAVTNSPPPPQYKDVNDYIVQNLRRSRAAKAHER